MRRGGKLAVATAAAAGGAAVAGLAGRLAERRRARELEKALSPTPPRGRFDETTLTGLPGPARRYLAHAIAPGTPCYTSARLRLAGAMRSGPDAPRFRFAADELLVARGGFVWRARGNAGAVAVRVTDHLVAGEGAVHVALFGIVPMDGSSGPDVARSSRHRLAAEAVWVPTALVPGDGVRWEGVDDTRVRVVVEIGGEEVPVMLEVAPSGRLETVTMERHGNEGRPDWGPTPYGLAVEAEDTFDGCTIPTRLRGGWWYGTERYDPDAAMRVDVVEVVPLTGADGTERGA